MPARADPGDVVKQQVPHLVVVVPGIGGSALRRGDRDLWRLSLPVAIRTLRSGGASLDELVPDDPRLLDDPAFDDGIEPAGLLESPITLPGLARLTGYGGLRSTLHDRYDLNEFNYVEFAYDWRRDVRHSARRLRETIDSALERLDPYVGRAEVIVIAHSMGGLVARWWLDRLGGADRCRGLITLGTPYRGSPKAIRMLTGGYVWRSLGSRRVAEVLRALPSVHQLLPMYPAVHVDDGWRYVHDLDPAVCPGIDPRRAAAGRDVLLAINETDRPTLTTVVAGVGQETMQSAAVRDGRLVWDLAALPTAWGPSGSHDGDATVPWIASRPLDQGSGGMTPTWVNQSHGGLSRDRDLLEVVCARLDHLLIDDDQARSAFDEVRLVGAGDATTRRLGLDLHDEYVAGEPVIIGITSAGLAPGTGIVVEVQAPGPDGASGNGALGNGALGHGASGNGALGNVAEPRHPVVAVIDESGRADVDLGVMPPGTHAVRVRPSAAVASAGLDVVDVIEVWDDPD